jgi:hypothetical protein
MEMWRHGRQEWEQGSQKRHVHTVQQRYDRANYSINSKKRVRFVTIVARAGADCGFSCSSDQKSINASKAQNNIYVWMWDWRVRFESQFDLVLHRLLLRKWETAFKVWTMFFSVEASARVSQVCHMSTFRINLSALCIVRPARPAAVCVSGN